MPTLDDAIKRSIAGLTMTDEQMDALVVDLMLNLASPEQAVDGIILGLNHKVASARIKAAQRARHLPVLGQKLERKLTQLAKNDPHPGVREDAEETLNIFAARQA